MSAYRANQNGSRGKFYLTRIGTLIAILAVWEALGPRVNPIFSSYPSAIAKALADLITSGRIFPALTSTLKLMLIGLVIAIVVGSVFGLLLGNFRLFEAAFGLYVTAGYSTPLIALIPLFILWFGLGDAVKITIVATLAVFPVMINSWAGVRSVPANLREVADVFDATSLQTFRKIVLPAALPFVVTGVRLAVGRGVIAIVLAEFFTAMSGLGALILAAGNRFDTAELLAAVLVLLLFGTCLDAAIRLIERRAMPWVGK